MGQPGGALFYFLDNFGTGTCTRQMIQGTGRRGANIPFVPKTTPGGSAKTDGMGGRFYPYPAFDMLFHDNIRHDASLST
jgi:hypothetical protein